ncbi:MAG: Re/Si-specific NAD(P)(+) transhydrogenase subunit alpha [bacterium]|nr:Re/Si-specific NAD(P)(+) transhydrogenase subunit alpha [bacterium]
MQVGILSEKAPGEHRVAATPQTAATYLEWGWQVDVESGAGTSAGFPDRLYTEAGANIVDGPTARTADIVLCVNAPQELSDLKSGSTLVGFLDPFVDSDLISALKDQGVTALAVEAIPRTTLAQSMDALSSQANIGGYAAALLAATSSPKLLPMMVTAAGTIPPSRALILGVGVAGLQAIATARRLGAVVHAYDIRPETAEQVESLGAKFVAAPTQKMDEGGYAKEVGQDTQAAQHAALTPHVAESDIVITTAQIPGRPAPLLVTDEMIAQMKPGSVIVDMAAGSGGNVSASQPETMVDVGGVHIYGPTNLPAEIPHDSSRMYARNLVALLERTRDEDGHKIDLDDEIIGGTTITHAGEVVHPRTRQLLGIAEPVAEPPASTPEGESQ